MPKPPHTEIATQVNPDPALEKRTRRSFTTEYKLKILAAADRCAHGELGALLRQERLYSNQLQQWRRDFAQGGVAGLAKTAPGPKPKFTAEEKALEKLRRENQRLTRELEIANGCLELQKKALAMRDHAMTGSDA
jgi:transposase